MHRGLKDKTVDEILLRGPLERTLIMAKTMPIFNNK